MIYIEKASGHDPLAFVSGDNIQEMKFFLNVVKATGVNMTIGSHGNTAVMSKKDIITTQEIMAFSEFNNFEYVGYIAGKSWESRVEFVYGVVLIDWREL